MSSGPEAVSFDAVIESFRFVMLNRLLNCLLLEELKLSLIFSSCFLIF